MKNSIGFTLAEVLIALAIIGIVSVIVLPPLMTNVTQYAFEQSQKNTLMKIQEATNEMKSNDALAGYATSEDFVNEFVKYMKVGQRCTSANLNKCFIPKFKVPSGADIDVTTLTTGDKLGHATYTSATVGLGLANGTTVVIAFNPNCVRIDPVNNTADTTSCLSMVYDSNGISQPNKIGKDIALLNATISTCSGVSVGGMCVNTSDTTYSPISQAPYMSNNNSWAGANKACIDQGMRLPTTSELGTMVANRVAIGSLNGWYWSSSVNAPDPWVTVRYFNALGTFGQAGYYQNAGGFNARCVK